MNVKDKEIILEYANERYEFAYEEIVEYYKSMKQTPSVTDEYLRDIPSKINIVCESLIEAITNKEHPSGTLEVRLIGATRHLAVLCLFFITKNNPDKDDVDELTNSLYEVFRNKNRLYQDGIYQNAIRYERPLGDIVFIQRLSEKCMRMNALLENTEAETYQESIFDTVMDMYNYAVIYLGYIKYGEHELE